MKKYYINVITGDGGYHGTTPYIIEADGYQTFESGYYMFYKRSETNEYDLVTVATFPIARTIITKIDNL